MAQKKSICLQAAVKSAAAKDSAARLTDKACNEKEKAWTQTFAASGAKAGGKTGRGQ